jgi:hypothetical protein
MPEGDTAPKESTLKRLFALSRNLCAFTGCTAQIVDRDSGVLTGQICHIKARHPTGPRYDPTQTDEARRAFENLIVLCRTHHAIVDAKPMKYSAELLSDMKAMHERHGDIELSQRDAQLAQLLIADYFAKIQPRVTQTVVGSNNVTIAGDQNVYQHPPNVRVVLPRRHGAISAAQCRTIQKWIETLEENTTGVPRERAFGMWWTRFKKRLGLNRYEELQASEFENARAWYQQQRAIGTRGLRNKLPDAWRNARYAGIKRAMQVLGESNDTYYPQLTERLNLRRQFTSLTHLTKRDLERVYRMALRDAQNPASGA